MIYNVVNYHYNIIILLKNYLINQKLAFTSLTLILLVALSCSSLELPHCNTEILTRNKLKELAFTFKAALCTF